MTQYQFYEKEVFKNLQKINAERRLEEIKKELESIKSAYNEENLYKLASTMQKLNTKMIEMVITGNINMKIAMHPEDYLAKIS